MVNFKTSEIGIVIPTFQASKHISYCLRPLLQSSLKPRILVIDSSSTDNTIKIAKEMGAETLVIPQHEFNHGTTREKGRQILQTPIVVMMTQDAYATSPKMLELLVYPILEKKASIAYARQIPHQGATILAGFHRHFNYPPTSHVRDLKDIATYGAYIFFCSNSCAAYRNAALDEIGGFPHVSFGEDALVTAKLLHRKHRIAYVAEAEVYHSHDYTLRQEFCRHFQMGLVRQSHRAILDIGELERRRGKDYLQALLKTLWPSCPSKIPYALVQTFIKYFGYRLGVLSCKLSNAPCAEVRKLP